MNLVSGVGMPQDGLLDHHKVLPRQDNSAGQAGVDTGDTGMLHTRARPCSQVNLTNIKAMIQIPSI